MVSVIEIALGKYENQIGDFPVLRAFPLSFETPRTVLFVYLWKSRCISVILKCQVFGYCPTKTDSDFFYAGVENIVFYQKKIGY